MQWHRFDDNVWIAAPSAAVVYRILEVPVKGVSPEAMIGYRLQSTDGLMRSFETLDKAQRYASADYAARIKYSG